jgi:outer membrane murein-binding lipoprotein Lpp
MQQREDVEHAKENLAAALQELDALNAELEEKVAAMRT